MPNYGYSFAPTAAAQAPGTQAPPRQPQQAIAFRNVSLPRADVPGQIAGPSLTGSPGALGMPNAQLLQMLMAAFKGADTVPFVFPKATPVTQTFAPSGPSQPSMGSPDTPPAPSAAQQPRQTQSLAPRISFGITGPQAPSNRTVDFAPSGPSDMQMQPFDGPSPSPVRDNQPVGIPQGFSLAQGPDVRGPQIDGPSSPQPVGSGYRGFDLSNFLRGQGLGI